MSLPRGPEHGSDARPNDALGPRSLNGFENRAFGASPGESGPLEEILPDADVLPLFGVNVSRPQDTTGLPIRRPRSRNRPQPPPRPPITRPCRLHRLTRGTTHLAERVLSPLPTRERK